jgi:FKBP-type peptidyl-prolyl cis-trans isomerase 2
MAQAKEGDMVDVHYTGTLDDGTVFDSSEGKDPLQFTLGEKQVIPGFEDAVTGMNPGDTKTVKILPEEAYGEHREEMVLTITRDRLPENLELFVGQQLKVPQDDGGDFVVRITELGDEEVTLDANHPLAGQELTFELKLLKIA